MTLMPPAAELIGKQPVLVPDLLGLKEADARDQATAAGFEIAVTVQSQGGGARSGRVWKQDPVGSSRRRLGSGVRLGGGISLSHVRSRRGRSRSDSRVRC